MIKSRERNLRFCHLETCFSQRSVKLISCCYKLSVVNLPLTKLNYFCNVKNVIENNLYSLFQCADRDWKNFVIFKRKSQARLCCCGTLCLLYLMRGGRGNRKLKGSYKFRLSFKVLQYIEQTKSKMTFFYLQSHFF